MKGATKAIVVAGAAFSLLLLGYFQGYLHGMTGGMSGALADANKVNEDNLARLSQLRGSKNNFVGVLDIEVKEKPFGMHLRRGSVIVEEVFHGFPAEKLGVREGCSIERIAGELIKQGTWLETFQKKPMPFKMTFICPPQSNTGHGPMSDDKHNYRVMVVKRPFGMNVQVNKVPRVVDVLPGSAAERAGVRAGFVLTHVQEQKVDKDTWFDAWQHAPLPAVLTFDTDLPVDSQNKFFNSDLIPVETPGLHAPHANLPDEWHEDDVEVPGFDNVRVTVKELPFGMHVDAPPGKLPIVKRVTPKLPADVAGVKAGDVLLKVAGHRVDSSTWYSAFQHAVPPFGLHFRRPHATVSSGKSDVLLPVMPTFGDMVVNVTKRPFGMKVKRSSNVVQDVFAGFPAQKAGVRKGCEIREIAGKNFAQGTWMKLFQKTKLPFQLKVFCGKAPKDAKAVPPSVLVDEHNFRVVVKERPFGMNVQTNTVPRVVEVLPGYPAEAAGVKAGYVLTAINDQPVDGQTWFDIWTDAPPGTVLTFDTNMPITGDNPYLSESHEEESEKEEEEEEDEAKTPETEHQDVKQGYTDFRAAVRKLPFGMLLNAPKGGRPTVNKIVKGSPAEQVGIKLGDILVEVAGLPVDTKTWFKSFQQAVPPFGLHFRRPDVASQAQENVKN